MSATDFLGKAMYSFNILPNYFLLKYTDEDLTSFTSSDDLQQLKNHPIVSKVFHFKKKLETDGWKDGQTDSNSYTSLFFFLLKGITKDK